MDKLTIAVIGTGYIGATLASAFSKHHRVIAYDTDKHRTAELKNRKDILALENIKITSAEVDVEDADVYLITVQSPVEDFNLYKPEFSFLQSAAELTGGFLKQGNAVILESTVFPGFTETLLKGWLEEASGLSAGGDFHLGYSPERVNPGDPERGINDITKIISGYDAAALTFLENLYQPILSGNIHKATSMKVAESAKLLENIQRDTNIALMNDMAKTFHCMGINTKEVLAAAKTKWNFLPFGPGLVGGHCIRVDPYYFIHQATQHSANPQFVGLAREINESMLDYVFTVINAEADKLNVRSKCKIALLGISFKANCSDFRNSLLIELHQKLGAKYKHFVCVDPIVDQQILETRKMIKLQSMDELNQVDILILGQSHQIFIDLGLNKLKALLSKQGIIIDLAHCFDKREYDAMNINFWQI